MRKVFFVIPTLRGGGAERVVLHITRYLDRNKFEPRLSIFERGGELWQDLPLDLQPLILKEGKLRYLYSFFPPSILFPFAKLLRKERPDVIMSFTWYSNAIAIGARFLSGLNCKIIVSERTSIATYIYLNRLAHLLRNFIIRFLYPKADLIISPAKEIAESLVSSYGIPREKVRVVHNPVDLNIIYEKAKENVEHPWFEKEGNIIVAVGRLGREKGFSWLIKAVSYLSRNNIDCRLVILGEGSERKNLEVLIKELGLEKRVELVGFQENPYKYLSHSTIFVLSSLYEGFPNVLLEALALGVPSIATRCPTGPEEIITDEVNGILVPPADEKALTDAIKRLLLDEDLRKRLSDAGKKRAEDFGVEKIIKQYEEVIERVCAESAAK